MPYFEVKGNISPVLLSGKHGSMENSSWSGDIDYAPTSIANKAELDSCFYINAVYKLYTTLQTLVLYKKIMQERRREEKSNPFAVVEDTKA